MGIMQEKILSNVELTEKEKLTFINKLDINVVDYITKEYNKIFKKWIKKYPYFNIPSGIISISIDGETLYIPVGEKKYNENTIFDIASMSKLYTEFILFDVIKDYNLSLNTKIKELTNLYKNINELTLFDLIKFDNTFKTEIDIRKCKNIIEGKKALRTTYIDEDRKGYFLYSDIPVMVLTDILEDYTKKSYKELFDKYIKEKYNLNDTYLILENKNVNRYVSLNVKYVNDPKANVFGGYYGHAGVKTTSKDFIKFINESFKSNIDRKLMTTSSQALNDKNNPSINKAVMANLNLMVPNKKIHNQKYSSLASNHLGKNGFAIQGSVRCHAETCIFNIDNQEHVLSMAIMIDIYTEYDNALKYEKNNDKIITSKYVVDNLGTLYMVDIRNLMQYKDMYKELVNKVGLARSVLLYKKLKEEE